MSQHQQLEGLAASHNPKFGEGYWPFKGKIRGPDGVENIQMLQEHKALAVYVPISVLVDGQNASALKFQSDELSQHYYKMFGAWWTMQDILKQRTAPTPIISVVFPIPHHASSLQTLGLVFCCYVKETMAATVELDIEIDNRLVQNYAIASDLPSAIDLGGEPVSNRSTNNSNSSSSNNNSSQDNDAAQDGGGGAPQARARANAQRSVPTTAARRFGTRKPGSAARSAIFGKILGRTEFVRVISAVTALHLNLDQPSPMDVYNYFSLTNALLIGNAHPDYVKPARYIIQQGEKTIFNIPNPTRTYRLDDTTMLWSKIDGMHINTFTHEPSERVSGNNPHLTRFNALHDLTGIDMADYRPFMSNEQLQLLANPLPAEKNAVFETAVGFDVNTAGVNTYDQVKARVVSGRLKVTDDARRRRTEPDADENRIAKQAFEATEKVQLQGIEDLAANCLNSHAENSRGTKAMLKCIEDFLIENNNKLHMTVDKTSTNLSYFADSQIRFMSHVHVAFNCLVGHPHIKMRYLSHLGSSDSERGKRIHILVTGRQGVDKSFGFEVVSCLSIPGTYAFSSYESGKSKISSGTDDNQTTAMHEASPAIFGVVEGRGNGTGDGHGSAHFSNEEIVTRFRNMLDTGVILGSVLELNPRRTVDIKRFCNGAQQVAANFSPFRADRAVIDRFLTQVARAIKPKGVNTMAMITAHQTDITRQFKDTIVKEYQRLESLVMLENILIDTDIMKKANTKLASQVFSMALDRLQRYGIQAHVMKRALGRLITASRTYAYWGAIHELFASAASPIAGMEYHNGLRGVMADLPKAQALLSTSNLDIITHVWSSHFCEYRSPIVNDVIKTIVLQMLLPAASHMVVHKGANDAAYRARVLAEAQGANEEGGESQESDGKDGEEEGESRDGEEEGVTNKKNRVKRAEGQEEEEEPQEEEAAEEETKPVMHEEEEAEEETKPVMHEDEKAEEDEEDDDELVRHARLALEMVSMEQHQRRHDATELSDLEDATVRQFAEMRFGDEMPDPELTHENPLPVEEDEGQEGAVQQQQPPQQPPLFTSDGISLHVPTHDGSYAAVLASVLASHTNVEHIDELLPDYPNFEAQRDSLMLKAIGERRLENERKLTARLKLKKSLEGLLQTQCPVSKLQTQPQAPYTYFMKQAFTEGLFRKASRGQRVSAFGVDVMIHMSADTPKPLVDDAVGSIEYLMDLEFAVRDDEGKIVEKDDGQPIMQHGLSFDDGAELVFISQQLALDHDTDIALDVIRSILEHSSTVPRSYLWCVTDEVAAPYRLDCVLMLPDHTRYFEVANTRYVPSGMRDMLINTLPRRESYVLPDYITEFSGSQRNSYKDVAPEVLDYANHLKDHYIPWSKVQELGWQPEYLRFARLVMRQKVEYELWRIEFAKDVLAMGEAEARRVRKGVQPPNKVGHYPELLNNLLNGMVDSAASSAAESTIEAVMKEIGSGDETVDETTIQHQATTVLELYPELAAYMTPWKSPAAGVAVPAAAAAAAAHAVTMDESEAYAREPHDDGDEHLIDNSMLDTNDIANFGGASTTTTTTAMETGGETVRVEALRRDAAVARRTRPNNNNIAMVPVRDLSMSD